MPIATAANVCTDHLNEHEHAVKTTAHIHETALNTDNSQQQQLQQQNGSYVSYQLANTLAVDDEAITNTNNTSSQRVRYCHICQRVKPDRAHHCSQCNECVLRMDHHCPWVVGCVGYANHKLFFLFLLYASMFTFYVAVTIAIMLALYIDDPRVS
jgi:hypothetical protein